VLITKSYLLNVNKLAIITPNVRRNLGAKTHVYLPKSPMQSCRQRENATVHTYGGQLKNIKISSTLNPNALPQISPSMISVHLFLVGGADTTVTVCSGNFKKGDNTPVLINKKLTQSN